MARSPVDRQADRGAAIGPESRRPTASLPLRWSRRRLRGAKGLAIQRTVPKDRIELLGWGPARGLTRNEVAARRAQFGPNHVLERAEPAWKVLARETARDPMLWFLVATAGLYAALGEQTEAWTLFASAIPLVAMDALLHRRTQASIEGLRSRLLARVRVLRDGRAETIASSELVPGDLVVVATGEHFPADGLVVAGDGLQVDESVLTGESYPVRKRPFVALPAPSIDAIHWAQAGTRLLTGEAKVRVLLTGGDTLYGEIVRSSRASGESRTPLQRSVARLVLGLVAVAAVLCVVLAGIRLSQGFGWIDAALSALTLAVAALPEEFPVVLAVFFGVGAHRLAHRKALVRRAASVENIGRVTCICSDKTGTITRGELNLAHLEPAESSSEDRLAQMAAYASRSESGDPLDEAILRACVARALDPKPPAVVATFPFTEDRRRETVVLARPDGTRQAAIKGAPELLLSLAALDDAARAAWAERVAELARGGHKVIACASSEMSAGELGASAGASAGTNGGAAAAIVEPDRGLVFEGLLAFEDPVREGVADAIAQCREAGIHVVMVTGDHRGTASAVAREIGLGGAEPRIVTGAELEARLASVDAPRLTEIDLVVRALPAQKLALVRALQAAGEHVAVTGDGVNDVPALQAADVGIAMSERASRSAREASAIVLLDDCFATIVAAIAEGRQLFSNLRRSFRYLLTIHIPLMLTAALVPLAGYPLLFLPIHIVWLELVIHPSALLAFQDLPAPGRLAGTAGHHGAGVLSRREGISAALVGLALTALVSYGFIQGLGTGSTVEHGRAMAITALCVASAGSVAGLSGLRTRASRWIVAATLLLSTALIEIPFLASRLHVTPLHRGDWALALAGGLVAWLPIGFELVFERRARRGIIGLRRAEDVA